MKKHQQRAISFILSILMLLTMLPSAAFAVNETAPAEQAAEDAAQPGYSGGQGTEASPYLIASAADLQALAAALSGESTYDTASLYFKQTADIDMKDIVWTGIGTQTRPFSGTYQGGGFQIQNLSGESGLFAVLGSQAALQSIVISGANITAPAAAQYTGALVNMAEGTAEGTISIQNCTVEKSTVKNDGKTSLGTAGILGGITSAESTLKITGCLVKGSDITANQNGGGIIGLCTTVKQAEIAGCAVTGTPIAGASNLGGIAGKFGKKDGGSTMVVRSCYSAADVTGTASSSRVVGGLIGSGLTGGVLQDSFATGKVISAQYAGGAIGELLGEFAVERVFATGNVENTNAFSGGFGGLAGKMVKTASIKNCVAMNAELTKPTSAGAESMPVYRVVGGYNAGTLENNYAFAQMTLNNVPFTAGDAAGQNGAHVVSSRLSSKTFWSGMGFDFDKVWSWDGTDTQGTPSLRAISEKQDVVIPSGALKFLTQPEDIVVYPFDTEETFTVMVLGDPDSLQYQWQVQKAGSTEWAPVDAANESAKTNALKLPVTYGQAYDSYRCVVTEGSTGTVITSNAVTLRNVDQKDIPVLSNLIFSKLYNGSNPYALSPAFSSDVKEYTLCVPYASYVSIYYLPEMDASIKDNYVWKYVLVDAAGKESVSNYSYKFSTSMTSVSVSKYVQLKVQIMDKSGTHVLNQYTIDMRRQPALKDLQIGGSAVLKSQFDTNLTEFEVYQTGNDGFTFTPALNPADAVLTFQGKEYESGAEVPVPASAIGSDRTVTFTVSGPKDTAGYQDANYTIKLMDPPKEEAPQFIRQELADANYTINTEDDIVPLKVYASASGSVTYQWYQNTEKSTDGAQAIQGATTNVYTPPVKKDGRIYYYCVATANGKTVASDFAYITVYPKLTAELQVLTPGEALPEVPGVGFEQDTGYYYKVNDPDVKPLKLAYTTSLDGTDYAQDISMRANWQVKTGTSITGGGSGLEVTPKVNKAGASYYTATVYLTLADQYVTLKTPAIYVHVQNPVDLKVWENGSGTKKDPWIIRTEDDLNAISANAKTFSNYKGLHFQLGNDLKLDENWKSLGAFYGTFDGGNHTLTFPEGSKALIDSAVSATVKNLKISCPYIKGNGLLASYTGNQSLGPCIDIINVTILSGTTIEGCGFLSGTGATSGSRTVNITGCTIEKGVTIGYNKETGEPSKASSMGSFAGSFNGTVQNSVSNATVYGGNCVGGLVASKCQSMGLCRISNSAFGGEIIATGEYVGGIIGRGYTASSAPNTPAVSVQNCYVTGKIQGKDNVGGIFGGENGLLQCWDNGIGAIQNNHFFGTIVSEGSNAGGIIGHMDSLNKYNQISNNYYREGCGADKGIGSVKYVDTSCATHETASGAEYFNTAVALPGIGGGTAGVIKTNHNRTDDPLGADAAQLAASATAEQFSDGTVTKALNDGKNSYKNWEDGAEGYPVLSSKPIAYELTYSGDFKRSYNIGEELDLTGIVFTAKWSDGTETHPDWKDVTITGFDSSERAVITVTASYGAGSVSFAVTILKPSSSSEDRTIDVKFTLLGDDAHNSEEDHQIHTLENRNLKTWIAEKTYTVDRNAKVADVFKTALKEAGLTWDGSEDNQYQTLYIAGITIPGTKELLSEFTNGPRSGWMYTLNGKHPDKGIDKQFLNHGDEIVFHYTDDYTQEEDSKNWSGGGGGGSTVNADDQKAANTVIDQIKAIGTVTKDSGDKITAARSAYDKLTEAQKKLVTNYSTLTDAERAYAGLTGKLPFTDVNGHWAYDAIKYAYENSLFAGTSATTFGPNVSMNRAMLVTVLYRLDKEPSAETISSFKDVPAGQWYTKAVAWASANKIVSGYDADTFGPTDTITREQMASILYRYAEYKGYDVSKTTDLAAFTDKASVSDWALTSMQWANAEKLINGRTATTLVPQGNATRAEVAQILMTFAETVAK